MELTRRDALSALAASGVAVVGGAALVESDVLEFGDDGKEPALATHDIDTLVAVARVVFPTEVTGIREFVTTYAVGRTEDRPGYRRGTAAAISTLDTYATEWYDGTFVELDRETRNTLLDEMGVATARPDPDGSDAARVRYYLVNDVLFALFTSPTGGKLVGTENPQGYPGGLDTYRGGDE
ncbi:gluconate 2-dehydrogenase subunit 3 family protein [Haladaptatus sp. T7]|uniref:gluconate 2-dehydrogenase subunit 3 family protein n=1 Tax=Haladaptatus sp. T7 TaxID=2029368 RepID=UPI0021A25BA2|nr:gluconate 2-dehydrogenase subunit 3 family protein [Haladaptatus sp. T7]GKZ13458.1 hypothetical protein HAL_13390 [Haladaptatus sp. T7]